MQTVLIGWLKCEQKGWGFRKFQKFCGSHLWMAPRHARVTKWPGPLLGPPGILQPHEVQLLFPSEMREMLLDVQSKLSCLLFEETT